MQSDLKQNLCEEEDQLRKREEEFSSREEKWHKEELFRKQQSVQEEEMTDNMVQVQPGETVPIYNKCKANGSKDHIIDTIDQSVFIDKTALCIECDVRTSLMCYTCYLDLARYTCNLPAVCFACREKHKNSSNYRDIVATY